jgi:hypothetical protein
VVGHVDSVETESVRSGFGWEIVIAAEGDIGVDSAGIV